MLVRTDLGVPDVVTVTMTGAEAAAFARLLEKLELAAQDLGDSGTETYVHQWYKEVLRWQAHAAG